MDVVRWIVFKNYNIIQLIFFSYVEDNPLFFSFDPEYGMFGWLSDPCSFALMIGFVSPWTSILTNYSLLQSYKYWPLDIVAVFFLTEPYFAEITAILLGQDEIPGLQTFIGIVVLSLGIILSIHGSKVKATQAINAKNRRREEALIELPENSHVV